MGEYCAKTLFVKGGPDEVKRDFPPVQMMALQSPEKSKYLRATWGQNGVKTPNTKHHLRDVYLQSNRPPCAEKLKAIELVEIALTQAGEKQILGMRPITKFTQCHF